MAGGRSTSPCLRGLRQAGLPYVFAYKAAERHGETIDLMVFTTRQMSNQGTKALGASLSNKEGTGAHGTCVYVGFWTVKIAI